MDVFEKFAQLTIEEQEKVMRVISDMIDSADHKERSATCCLAR